jgi:hypothetical protein
LFEGDCRKRAPRKTREAAPTVRLRSVRQLRSADRAGRYWRLLRRMGSGGELRHAQHCGCLQPSEKTARGALARSPQNALLVGRSLLLQTDRGERGLASLLDRDPHVVGRSRILQVLEERLLRLGPSQDALCLACECLLPDCERSLTATPAEFAALRSDPAYRLVAPGHVSDSKHEQIVIRANQYWVLKPLSPNAARRSAREDAAEPSDASQRLGFSSLGSLLRSPAASGLLRALTRHLVNLAGRSRPAAQHHGLRLDT